MPIQSSGGAMTHFLRSGHGAQEALFPDGTPISFTEATAIKVHFEISSAKATASLAAKHFFKHAKRIKSGSPKTTTSTWIGQSRSFLGSAGHVADSTANFAITAQ